MGTMPLKVLIKITSINYSQYCLFENLKYTALLSIFQPPLKTTPNS